MFFLSCWLLYNSVCLSVGFLKTCRTDLHEIFMMYFWTWNNRLNLGDDPEFDPDTGFELRSRSHGLVVMYI